MKKIITSISIMVAVIGVVIGGTTAFFSDTETSSGNTFTAGAIDLKVDNESYYNRNVCTDVDPSPEVVNWQWQGNALFPVPETECSTSFPESDLDKGLLFFDFADLKPDDEGEDTISLHVGTNDAWACMELTLKSDDDISSNEPELGAGDVLDTTDLWDGELADVLEFFWWADDGDNVYEVGENQISDGVQTLTNLAPTEGSFDVPLADSENNVWTPNTPGPIPGNQTVYIAKAWCFGDLTLDAVTAGQGENPSVDPGVNCDGVGLGNLYQTDGVTIDVAFTAIQARHNETFLCNPVQEPTDGTLVVEKIIENGDNPNPFTPDDFSFEVNGGGAVPFEEDGSNSMTVVPGLYTVTEPTVPDYETSYNNCENVQVDAGETETCTIKNTYAPLCQAAVDLMIVMDNSTSIDPAEEDLMQAGAVSFVTALDIAPGESEGGLTSFDDSAVLSQGLTDSEATLTTAINAGFGSGFTNLEDGILVGQAELATNGDAKPNVMVIITDGDPTACNAGGSGCVDPEGAATTAANAAKLAGTTIYVVGVGAEIANEAFLETIASTPAHYYSADEFDDLELALLTIANCGEVPTGTLTVTKIVTGEGAPDDVGDFDLFADATALISEVSAELSVGSYALSEAGPDNYVLTFGGDADCADGIVDLDLDEVVSCTMTNTYIPDVDVSLNPSSGSDSTPTGSAVALTAGNLTAISSSNDTRYTSISDFQLTTYTPSEAIDFAFPDIPGTATVNSVSLNFEWQRESDIDAAQLSVSTNGGTTFGTPASLVVPAAGTDTTVVVNLFTLNSVNTVAEVNGLVIRFQANSDGVGGNYNTSHDWVQIDVNYTP